PSPPAIVATPRPVALADIAGALLVRGTPVKGAVDVLGTDELASTPRRGAGFTAGGARIRLERGGALRVDTLVHLLRGSAFFEGSVTVVTKHGQISGTSFGVDVDDRRARVAALAGPARLSTDKGDATLKAGFVASLRATEKPSGGARGDVESLLAWRLRPELSPNPARTPYVEREPGGNRRPPGLVIAAPYADAEEASEAVARAVAERLDAPLVLARHYRAPAAGLWINVDRAMEATVGPDGTPGATEFTARSRKASADYFDQLREAAGAGRGPVPLVVQARLHYDKDLPHAEAAFAGIPKAAVARLKALYPALLDKHAPAVRVDMKFQGVDPVRHAEEDPRIEGYMAPRQARAAACFFLPAAAADGYGPVLADLIEALYRR
ncbi:MAG TPA: hypothetical protein VF950_19515, partial [Planctomycetota bacterium]